MKFFSNCGRIQLDKKIIICLNGGVEVYDKYIEQLLGNLLCSAIVICAVISVDKYGEIPIIFSYPPLCLNRFLKERQLESMLNASEDQKK